MSKSLPFLRKFLFQKPIPSIVNPRKQPILNAVIPNLYQNLLASSKAFIDAVVNQDLQFLQVTTSKQLFNHIKIDISQLQQQQCIITKNQQQVSTDDSVQTAQKRTPRQIFVVYPYVKFGVSLKSKEYEFPGNHKIVFGKNKFLFMSEQRSLMENFRAFGKEQIYGFNCLYLPKAPTFFRISGKDIQPEEIDLEGLTFTERLFVKANKFQSIQGQIFMITFQTDANKLDFVIQDAQNYISRMIPPE